MIEREELASLLKQRYSLSDVNTDNVLEYAYSLSQSANKPNDFAVAYELNKLSIGLFEMVADNDIIPDITDINRSYILICDELKSIYSRNKELENIGGSICWKNFDMLEYIHNDLGEYKHFIGDDYGYGHVAQVHRLCILNKKETPDLSSRLAEMISTAKQNGEDFFNRLNETEEDIDILNDSYIPSYTLSYDNDGIIWVNNVLRLNKNHIGRNPDLVLSQAFKHDGETEPFLPEIATSRKLSTILSDMGFNETLRMIFFPVVNQSKGIVFRSHVGWIKVRAQKIDTTKLDKQLYKLGAEIAKKPVKPIDLSEIPF
jgi:hypothetical protein